MKSILLKQKNNKHNNTSLTEIEQKLSKFNSKSCDLLTFLEYAKLKYLHYDFSTMQCGSEFLQKKKWYTYLNTRRHEDRLVNVIKKEFGSNVKIIIGDWSGINSKSRFEKKIETTF